MLLHHKAMLYSAFIFPGSGYFIVKRKVLGLVFIVLTMLLLVPLMIEANHKAQIIAQQIVYGDINLNILAIRERIEQVPGILSNQQVNFIYGGLLLLWLVGILDTYRLAKKLTPQKNID